jgi:hypothetical protein
MIDRVRDYIGRRRNAYCRTFLTPFGNEVLEDLAKFCRATETTFHPDPRVHAVAEGRKEVWLRIQRHLQLSDEQLWAFHAVAPTPSRKESDD